MRLRNIGRLRAGGSGFSYASLFAAGEPGVHYETYNPDSLLQRRNQLTYTEFPNGTADLATATGGLVAAGAMSGYSGAIAIGRDGATNQIAYKNIGSTPVFTGAPCVISVVVEMDDGLAPTFGSAAVANVANDFTLVAGGASISATTYVVEALGANRYRVSAPFTGSVVTSSYGIIKWSTNSTRTFKTTAWQFDANATTASAYQKVTDWNTEYLAAAGSRVHLWQDDLRTVPVTAVEQTVGAWDDLSGNGKHATQATTGSKPKLSARYNLLTKTEQLTDSAWGSNVTVTVTGAASDPVGGNTAFTVAANAADSRIGQFSATTAQVVQTFWLRRRTGTGVIRTFNGVAYVPLAGVTNAWQQFTVLGDVAPPSNYFIIQLATAGDAVDIWHPDLRVTNDAALNQPAYQRVNTATDYDTAGFIHYLKFDGIDDSLQTPAIDMSACSKMTVWAGVTKLSDSAASIIAELNTTSAADGSFYVAGPGSAATNFGFSTRGTTANTARLTDNYAAPVTAVVNGALDNSAATAATQVQPRVNGAVPASVTTQTGPTFAGNYANAALNIGRRNNASLPFNGRLTSLTVRGTTTPTSVAFIKSMEQYAAKLAGQTFTST